MLGWEGWGDPTSERGVPRPICCPHRGFVMMFLQRQCTQTAEWRLWRRRAGVTPVPGQPQGTKRWAPALLRHGVTLGAALQGRCADPRSQRLASIRPYHREGQSQLRWGPGAPIPVLGGRKFLKFRPDVVPKKTEGTHTSVSRRTKRCPHSQPPRGRGGGGTRPRARLRNVQNAHGQRRRGLGGGQGAAVQQVGVSEVVGASGLSGDGRATPNVSATELSQMVEAVSLGFL